MGKGGYCYKYGECIVEVGIIPIKQILVESALI